MKNSLGTLAAVAALAAGAHSASAEIVVATHLIDRVVIPGQDFLFDIANQGVADFSLINNGERLQGLYTSGPAQVAVVAGSGDLAVLGLGDIVGPVSDFSGMGWMPSDQTLYVGLEFYISGLIHYGWIQFKFDEDDLIVASAAWESSPGVGLTIVPVVPEPSTYAAATALIAGAAILLHRRGRNRSRANG